MSVLWPALVTRCPVVPDNRDALRTEIATADAPPGLLAYDKKWVPHAWRRHHGRIRAAAPYGRQRRADDHLRQRVVGSLVSVGARPE